MQAKKQSHLYSSFCEVDSHGQIFPHEDVRIVSLGEGSLQLLQLVAGERGAESPLLSLHRLSVGTLALGLCCIALWGLHSVLFRRVALLCVLLVQLVGHLCGTLLHGDWHCCANATVQFVLSACSRGGEENRQQQVMEFELLLL